MKPHYFDQDKPDEDDFLLSVCINQGYVPIGCLLGGQTILGLINEGKVPCTGCGCLRKKCGGKRI